MTHKTATIETNHYEREIFAAATHYGVKSGKLATQIFTDEQAARACAEELSAQTLRGTTLYAVAKNGQALLATYDSRRGWKESDR